MMLLFYIVALSAFSFSGITSVKIQDYELSDVSGDGENMQLGYALWPVNKARFPRHFKLLKRDAEPGNTNFQNVSTLTPAIGGNDTKINMTITEKAHNSQMDLTNPGVVKRGLIVFGGFTLLAVAYFIFYRKKGKKNENVNSHNAPDSLQFRYGILPSVEMDQMELSRVPLTMESDDDDDDDLEIFDLEQKKKSLSYVNLKSQADNAESFTILNKNNQDDIEKSNLLLDIEDKNTEALINLTGNSSKSIL